MKKFKAYRVFNEDGKVSGRLVEATLDELDPGQVVIKAAWSSVNYKDALAATGAGKIMKRMPLIGGIDVSGHVLHSEDPRYKEGDAVLVTGYDLGVDHDGGYAEIVRVPGDWVVPLPQGLSLEDAMTIGTAGFTAGLSVLRMEQNGLRPANGPVIVLGASGGVGSVAVDCLAALGYEVVAVTGKDSEHEYLRHLGAKQVLSRQALEMGKRPLEKSLWAGAVDPVGGEMLAWLTRTMKNHGVIASCGLTGGIDLNTTVLPFILRGVCLLGIDSVFCQREHREEVWRRMSTDMRPRHLREMTRVVTLEQLDEVFASLIKGGVKGRTVVKLD
jgi:NADPH2:quinone reductase